MRQEVRWRRLSHPSRRNVLNWEVPSSVVADRINGYLITLFELGVVVSEGAQDHGVAGPGRQQVVHLRPHLVVATYPASGLQVEPIDAWGQLHRLHGLDDNAVEHLGHRHGPSSSSIPRPARWSMVHSLTMKPGARQGKN